MLSKVQELATHFVVTCDDKASFAATNYVIYGEGRRATVAYFWRLGGVTS